ncbi:hypothetical protein B5F07_10455 [Lachnoclostridium sp. An169]|uniref:sensor histidine kinase n=1 Tax=Lachnoclostridium sp. An169 TaxID=1965569 RepID=UPI000B38FD1D|nr:sensor histidine kinase [Lachnoclostridium sp. An169]OUP83391.1 hypothetical protein B5F07_10455 [Lachnoclostridium sp. An169]HJA64872.1 histidine kinase [Candidatus Mediterraneibacter cottocaccae]
MKQKYFIHKFIRYFFIFSLPVIIIGLLLSIFSYIQIRKNTNSQAQSTFQTGTRLMEEILTKGDEVAVMLNNSTDVSMSMYRILNQASLNYKENAVKDIMYSILENVRSGCNYIDSVYIYYPNENDIFFQTGRQITSISDTPDQQWLSDFKSHTDKEDAWIVNRSFQNYSFEAAHEAVTIYRRINYYDGVLVINLNQSVLSQLLASIENYSNEAILVTDSAGRLLFSNDNASAMNFDKNNSVHLQLSLSASEEGRYLMPVRYEGESYILTEFTYPEYGLHFLSLVPTHDIYQLMYQILYCAVAGVIIAAVLCLIFSFYLTNKNFSQIEQLLDILWQAETGTYPLDGRNDQGSEKLDEYNLILNHVIHTFVRNNALTLQVKEGELKKTLSELKALQLQINPHFFFNTLQSIDMEIVKQEGYQAPASRLIHALSDILRYALGDSSSPVTLREEICSCKEYVEIQKFHHPGQIALLWEYDEDILNCRVIRMLFQPLLENSIQYSIHSPQDSLVIRIKILDRGDSLRFHILDNGAGIRRDRLTAIRKSLDAPDDQKFHIGVRNTHKRLTLSYPGNNGLTILSHEGQGTCISFSIPK